MTFAHNMEYTREQSEARTLQYYAYIGALATQFAAMEIVLADATRQLYRNTNEASDRDLNNSFEQLTKAFQHGLLKTFGAPVAEGEDAKCLIERIKAAGKSRNDILHSAWSAYKDGQVAQHRARSKNKSLPLIAKYEDQQLSSIESVTDEVMELRSDIPYWLDVFKEMKESEQSVPDYRRQVAPQPDP